MWRSAPKISSTVTFFLRARLSSSPVRAFHKRINMHKLSMTHRSPHIYGHKLFCGIAVFQSCQIFLFFIYSKHWRKYFDFFYQHVCFTVHSSSVSGGDGIQQLLPCYRRVNLAQRANIKEPLVLLCWSKSISSHLPAEFLSSCLATQNPKWDLKPTAELQVEQTTGGQQASESGCEEGKMVNIWTLLASYRTPLLRKAPLRQELSRRLTARSYCTKW